MIKITSDRHPEGEKKTGGSWGTIIFIGIVGSFFGSLRWFIWIGLAIYAYSNKESLFGLEDTIEITEILLDDYDNEILIRSGKRLLWKSALDNVAWMQYDAEREAIQITFENPSAVHCFAISRERFVQTAKNNAQRHGAHLAIKNYSKNRFDTVKDSIGKMILGD